jgi:solute carrier family 34 (sodium-dependent phosphate cotransporter)
MEVSQYGADPPAAAPVPVVGRGTFRRVLDRTITVATRVALFASALFFFIGSLQMMKTGAAGLEALQNGGFLVHNAGSTLGLGWIGALIVLSGSPVAASSLTLVAARSITESEGFAMLTGSRLGAAFVVLCVAVVYALRGGKGKRGKPLTTAVMTLTMTIVVYLPAGALGLWLVDSGTLAGIPLSSPAAITGVIEGLFGPIIEKVSVLPDPLIFVGGLLALLLSFKLIDAVMPSIKSETLDGSRYGWLQEKWPMFLLGCIVALVTMSVSVALTVLVPLVAKGYVQEKKILPYIMGANITTLGDTLLAAYALQSEAAVRIVLIQVFVASVVTLTLLTFFYPRVQRAIWVFQRAVVTSKPRLASFTAALFLVPLSVMLGSSLVA